MCVYDFTFVYFFFFKQKTAYEMRISDWSSDVCSSDLRRKTPETDEQIGCQADAFPTEEHLDEIVRGHEHQHREGEEREIGEEEIGSASGRERVCQYV